jgi:glycosyltransferase involved in cell wall biosynthesis
LFHVAQAGIAEYVANHIADYCIVVSEFQRKRLLLKGFPSLNVEMVRNGVDTSLFRPDGGESNGKFVVCYAGAMQEYQDIESLVRAFKGIKNQDVKLKLIGFADEDQGLKRRISGILKERVELYDKMPQEEMIRHLGSADVLVLPRKKHPSMLYGFPVKFAEYIAMGKTVIVSDADETSELVRKHRCGLVYEASDSGSLQRSLLEAIGSSKDMRLKMGTNARRLAVAEFDWSKIASRYSVFLANVIKDYKERSK